MPRKWNKQDWYQFHARKAAQEAIERYAPNEKQALDEINRAIKTLDEELSKLRNGQSLTSWMFDLTGLTDRGRKISDLQADLDRLLAERSLLHSQTKDAISSAAARGVEIYNAARITKAAETQEARARRQQIYEERLPAIRTEQRTLRSLLIEEQSINGKIQCHYCRQSIPAAEAHLDHKTPVVRGGTNKISNLVLACAECNLKKGKKTSAHFQKILDSDNQS